MFKVTIESIAEQCHEANRVFCQQLGDNSQVAWSDAPEWQKKSAITGVELHLEGIQMGNIVTPEESHNSWMKEKIADGWIYGEVKNAELKTHPCITDYKNLPRDQQIKDHIFGSTVLMMSYYY